VREKRWTQLYIAGKAPEDVAHEANVVYGNAKVRPKGRR
jgi:hypothetical protein